MLTYIAIVWSEPPYSLFTNTVPNHFLWSYLKFESNPKDFKTITEQIDALLYGLFPVTD